MDAPHPVSLGGLGYVAFVRRTPSDGGTSLPVSAGSSRR